jgi:hypothetical protein
LELSKLSYGAAVGWAEIFWRRCLRERFKRSLYRTTKSVRNQASLLRTDFIMLSHLRCDGNGDTSVQKDSKQE